MKRDKRWLRRWLSFVLVLVMLLGDVRGILPVHAEGDDPSEPVVTEETTEPTTAETTEPETTEPETSEPETTVPGETGEPETEATTAPDGSADPENGTETEPSEPDSDDGAETETEIVYTVDLTQFWAGVERLKEIFGAMEQPEAERVVQLLTQLRELVTACFTKVVEKPVVTEPTGDEAETAEESGEGTPAEEVPSEEPAGETTASEEPVEEETTAEETTAGNGDFDDDFFPDDEFGVGVDADKGPDIPDAQMQPIVAILTELMELIFGTGEADEDEEKSEVEQFGLFELLENPDDQLAVEEFFSLAAELLGYRPEAHTVKWFNIDTNPHPTSSYHLNPNDGHKRFFIEYFADFRESAGVPRVTKIYVYLKQDETLCLGSSIKDSAFGKDIEIFDEAGISVRVFNNSTDTGYITSRAQEKNGPKLAAADENNSGKYMPHTYPNDTGKDQKFMVIFYSQKNKTSDLGVGGQVDVSGNFLSKQGGSTIAAWDATVVGLKEGSDNEYEVKTGRTWADYLAITTSGDASIKADLELYVLTKDNYDYRVKMNEIAPFGFVFFANNMGFTRRENGYDYSIYHSFTTADAQLNSMNVQGIQLHNPGTADTGHQITHYIFFEKPSAAAKGALTKTPEDFIPIQSIQFEGIADGVSQYGSGGDFIFNVRGATSVSIRIDFTEMLDELKKDPNKHRSVDIYEGEYSDGKLKGRGIVELNSTVVDGTNTIYWDGKDINGFSLPVGYYVAKPSSNAEPGSDAEAPSGAEMNSAAKIHISAEAKRGEVHFPIIDVEAMYGGITIERLGTDAANRFDVYYNNTPLKQYTLFRNETAGAKVKRGTYGVKFYPVTGTTYTYESDYRSYFPDDNDLSTLDENSAKHEPKNSQAGVMRFTGSGYYGGGNNAGIDMWTYYKPDNQTAELTLTSFAILDHPDTKTVTGRIFYDSNHDGKETGDASGLADMHVRLVDAEGNPIKHTVLLPVYDEFGDFQWEDGHVKEEEREIAYEGVTDLQGRYTLTGVYIPEGAEYYVQVELDKNQRDYLQYVCTTNRAKLYPGVTTIETGYGGDGNAVTWTESDTGITKLHYEVDTAAGKLYPIFKPEYATPIDPVYETVDGKTIDHYEAKTIGYYTAIPAENQRQLTVKKKWGVAGNENPPVPEIIVELYMKTNDPIDTDGSDGQGKHDRKGVLLDTVVLNAANQWSFTWKVVDSRQSYFFVEYYYKVKNNIKFTPDGIVDISGEPIEEKNHRVLIAATAPIFDSQQSGTVNPYFGSNERYLDAVTDKERESTIDTDSLLFDMKYTAKKAEGDDKHNVVTLYNTQTYDERAYYIWAGKDITLPDFVTKSSVVTDQYNQRRTVPHSEHLRMEGDTIKGLTVKYYLNGVLQEGDWAQYFRVLDDTDTSVVVTGQGGDQKPVPGTYTFQCTYTKDVSIEDAETTQGTQQPELIPERHRWIMTLHIYDVGEQGVFYYSPLSDDVHVLVGDEVTATGETERRNLLFANDKYRIELQPDAINRSMGTCADVTGIYITTKSPEEVQRDGAQFVDIKTDEFVYSRDTDDTGAAIDITISVSKSRMETTNRDEDHVDFTTLSFQPKKATDLSFEKKPTYVYYRYVVLSEAQVHDRASHNQDTEKPDPVVVENDSTKGVTMYTYFTVKPLVSELIGATLSVGETIDLNFYVDILDAHDIPDPSPIEWHSINEYYVDFVLDRVASDGLGHVAEKQTYIPGTSLTIQQPDPLEPSQTDTLYGFTFKDLNAYQMGEIVTARLWMKRPDNTGDKLEDILVDERDFSIKQYAYTMLQQKDAENQVLREMLVDMLNYGAEAQQYAYSSGWITQVGTLANSFLGVDLLNRHLKAEIPESEKYTLVPDTGSDKITQIAVGLTMQESMQMSLRIGFKLADQDFSNYSLYIVLPNETPQEITGDHFVLKDGGSYGVNISGISPFHWKDRLKLEFRQGEKVIYTLTYGVSSYCYDMKGQTGEGNLAKAIYQFGVQAKNWDEKYQTSDIPWKDKVYGQETIPGNAA